MMNEATKSQSGSMETFVVQYHFDIAVDGSLSFPLCMLQATNCLPRIGCASACVPDLDALISHLECNQLFYYEFYAPWIIVCRAMSFPFAWARASKPVASEYNNDFKLIGYGISHKFNSTNNEQRSSSARPRPQQQFWFKHNFNQFSVRCAIVAMCKPSMSYLSNKNVFHGFRVCPSELLGSLCAIGRRRRSS